MINQLTETALERAKKMHEARATIRSSLYPSPESLKDLAYNIEVLELASDAAAILEAQADQTHDITEEIGNQELIDTLAREEIKLRAAAKGLRG